jgi:hypothetical protein
MRLTFVIGTMEIEGEKHLASASFVDARLGGGA